MSHYAHALISLLHQLAESDQKLHSREIAFIQYIYAQHPEINTENLSEKFPMPKSEYERMKILFNLLFLIKSDGNLDDLESQFLRKIIPLLGFRLEMLNKMLDAINSYDDSTQLPSDTLLKIVKPYLN